MTRKNAQPSPIVRHGFDGNPPELVSVRGTDPETRVRATVQRNANHCKICWLHRQGYLKDKGEGGAAISDLRHQAAERLQDDFSRAGLASIPSTLAALTAPGNGGNGGGNATEDAMLGKVGASQKLEDALTAAGHSARFLLIKIVLEDCALKDVAKIMGVSSTALMPALRVALDGLTAHYGLRIEARAKIRGGPAAPLHPFQSVSHGTTEEK